MNDPIQPFPPIGHLLRKADHLITLHSDRVQAVNNVTRFEWQVLNVLHEKGPSDREELFKLMRIFIDADELDATIVRLQKEGWLENSTDAEGLLIFQLTPSGEQHHSVVFAAQKLARAKAMEGISDQDHQTTLRVLQQIVDNLDFEDQG